MPIELKWHSDKPHVLLMEFAGSWHFHDLEHACLTTQDMANGIAEDVYSIVYAIEPLILPPSFRISQLSLITNRPAACRRIKLAHIIAHKPHIHHMFNLYFQIYPRHRDFIKVVDNWEDAMTSIHEDQFRHKNDKSRHATHIGM